MEKPTVSGITYKTDEAMIGVQGLPGGTKALKQIFAELAAHDILIDMITQSQSAQNAANFSFTVPDEDSSKAFNLLQKLATELGAQGVNLTRDIAKISVVGAGMRFHAGISARLFEALSANEIEVKMISTSEIKISVIIPRKYCEMAVRALHQTFIETEAKADAGTK